MRSLKVGYWPISKNLEAAGDRRRVVFWANTRGHEIVTDLSNKVDVLVVSERADFRSRYLLENKVPIVFDLVDAYLCTNSWVEDISRGISKRIDRQITSGFRSFSGYVKEFCKKANAVICSSPEQEVLIKFYNSNTHVILDSHEEIPFLTLRSNRELNAKKRGILWEGQPATIPGLSEISGALGPLKTAHEIELFFVSDKSYKGLFNKYFDRNTYNLIKRNTRLEDKHISLISWNIVNLVEKANNSSFGIIPINVSAPVIRFKPENRILIMWRLGLPALVSPSPAYKRVSTLAGVSSICESEQEWCEKMQILLENPSFAQREALLGQSYVRESHTREKLLAKWDAAIESALS